MKLKKTITSIPLLLTTLTSQILLHTPVTAQTATPLLCAVPGKDGPSKNLEGIINAYYAGASERTVPVGAKDIPVDINPRGFNTSITAGDLLLIIQMQGAEINPDDGISYGGSSPGSGNTNNNFTAGTYEYVVATEDVPSGSSIIKIRGTGPNGGLNNSYTNASPAGNSGQRTYQIIRVPQYSNATLTGTLTAAPWNGSSGGVLVYDVAGKLELNSQNMDVSSKGFRGGGGIQLNKTFPEPVPELSNNNYRTRAPSSKDSNEGANGSKGEGTAGTPRYTLNLDNFEVIDNGTEGYPEGSFGRGAPGNAGGGSTDGNPKGFVQGEQVYVNDQNSGGGGGGNGGVGGKGGKPWKSGEPPQNLDRGGLGGDEFSVASSDRVVMGGGGGAGTNNDGTSESIQFPDADQDKKNGNNTGSTIYGGASSGAPGGGIVLLRTGRVSGTGEINANGREAFNVRNDGGGGGGAGGSVIVSAVNNVGSPTSLTINANGGKGGDAKDTAKHGPGGGGGGGVILTNLNLTTAPKANGGDSGFTGSTTNPTDRFGAEKGDPGKTSSNVGSIPGVNSGAECVPQLTVKKITSNKGITNKPGKATYTITVENAVGRATATQVRITDPLPTLPTLLSGFTYDGTTNITITDRSTGALQNVNPTIIPSKGATNLDFGTFDISGGSTLSITFTTDVGVNVPDGVYQNGATATYLDPQRTTDNGTTSSTYDPASSPGEDVIVGPIPPPPLNSMRGVKRITNVIRNGVPLAGVNFGAVIDDPSDINDDASIWANSQLAPVGVTRIDPQLKLRVGDEVEYTVYFLVDGNESISNARFCDPIPQGTSFISNSGSDITLNIANTITNQTNIADADRASIVNAVAPLPANNVCPNQSNPTGAVLVNFGTLDSTPGNNFGYTRFRVRVD